MIRTAFLILLTAFSSAFVTTEVVAIFAEMDSVKLDHSKVRHGNPADFDPEKGDKVATVRSKEVYKAIPAYQTILKEKVKQGTARYTQLMQEATRQFRRALKTAAEKGNFVLIVEQGGISGYLTVDVTAGIVQSL